MPQAEATSSPLEPGTLWSRVEAQTCRALEIGALRSIPTHCEFIEDGGLKFLVRSLDNIVRKEKARKQQEQARASGKPANPFLPYEPDLFVSHLSDTHLCLLNKYNVVDHHLLIVTRAFEEQENWLNYRDFEALWTCMAEVDGLAFYNGGRSAGASQPHKHLQLVPTLLATEPRVIPVETLILGCLSNLSTSNSMPHTVDGLPFAHAVCTYCLDPQMPTADAAAFLTHCYSQLVHAVGMGPAREGDRQSGAYNVLMTRRWMMLVPRSQDSFASISINSLGFAGSLFVSTEKQMKTLKDYGPMTLLKNVARSL